MRNKDNLIKKILIYFYITEEGNWDNIYENIKNKIEPNRDDIEKVLKNNKVVLKNWCTIIDNEYPNALKFIEKPPFVLCKDILEHRRYIELANIINKYES